MRPNTKRQSGARSAASARPFISACLIVKNEEDNLDRCLRSVAPAVDEIVLVDTGSTDRTVEIAEKFGARVFHFTWCDDFSAARNESLRHARGEWIVWVDGDDELVEAQPGALRQLCSQKVRPEWGWWAEVRSPYGATGELEVAVQHWRIFRKDRGIWFRGRVHEEPWPPEKIEPHHIGRQEQVRVTHWGYIPKGNLMQLKSERNRRLLELSLKEEPSRPLHYYNLGRQLNREGDFAGALKLFQRGLELWHAEGAPNWSFAHSLFSFAAQSAVESGQFTEALRIEGLAPPHLVSAELLCQAGIALWRLERRAEAIDRLNRAWQDPSVINPHLHDVSKSTWQPLLMLSGLYDQTGRAARAYECAAKAAAFAPDHPEVLLAAGYLAGKQGRNSESLQWLRKLLTGRRDDGFKAQGRHVLLQIGRNAGSPDLVLEALGGEVAGTSPEECVVLRAAAHAQRGDAQAQYRALADGVATYPRAYAIRFALADLLSEQGGDLEALNLLGEALDDPDAPAESYKRLSLLLAKLGRFEDARHALQVYAHRASEPAILAAS